MNALHRQKIAPLKRELSELESRISHFESEIESMESAMADPDFFKHGDETAKKMDHYESLKRRLTRAYDQWEKRTEALNRP